MKINRGCILNPITLFFLTILSSLLVFLGNDYIYIMTMIYSLILILSYSRRKFIKDIIIGLILILLLRFFIEVNIGIASGTFIALIALFLRVYPVFIIGSILKETSPMRIMWALRWLRIPNSVSIALVTSLRFLDEMGIRLKEIKAAMKVRGLKVSLKHPIYSFELYLVPLVYKCLHISETLVSSIISRGAEYEGRKTSYIPLKFGLYDYIYFLIPLILLGWSL